MISWLMSIIGYITVACFIYAAGVESEKQKQQKKSKVSG